MDHDFLNLRCDNAGFLMIKPLPNQNDRLIIYTEGYIEIQIQIQINTIYTMTIGSFYNYLKLTGHQVDLQYYYKIMKDAASTGTCEYYCDYYINQIFPDELE